MIYEILGNGKHWATTVDNEKMNCDRLMFANIDHNHLEIRIFWNQFNIRGQRHQKGAVWLVSELQLGDIQSDRRQTCFEGVSRALLFT